MATLSPQATDKLNNPSHSLIHRIITVDGTAAEGSLHVTADGNINIASGKTYMVNNVALSSGQTLFECIVAPSGGDYTTLGAALAANKTRIFIRNGTYSETGENTIKSNTVITGESMENVVIDVDGTTNRRFLINPGVNVTNVQITNLTLKSTTVTDYIIDSNNVNSTSVSDWLIQNVHFDGGGMQLGTNGGSVSLSGYFILRDCYLTRLTSGECVYFRAPNGTTSYLDYLEISGCKTDMITTNKQIFAGADNMNIKQLLVCNNTFYSTAEALFSTLRMLDSTAGASFLITGNIIRSKAFLNFSNYNFQGKGSIINNTFVYQGTPASGINLIPAGAVVANNVFMDNNSASAYCITMDAWADGSIVTGNKFINCTYGINLNSGCTSPVICNNYFDGITKIGILDDGSTTPKIYNNVGLPTDQDIKIQNMTNASGGTLNAGDVVVLKSSAAGNEITTTTTAGDNKVFGVVYSASIANTVVGLIQTGGKLTTLKVDGTTDIAIGDYLSTFTTAKITKKASAGETAFAIALEAYSTDDSAGVIDALLISPRLI